ncbi:uncharacterized protein EV420DRAFT_1501263 [Desarmillaria tabescens]|uniref:Uncharacterized protein n=1 Tax=Armillaria tabescens TaxID=1929756 RepID=A0AA39NLF6_ARMTA|nr:uncharacterized protein EV420DRAFT_1501263 [Desarmillaria tabescens]KAK0467781.1 hypothetical protein EV420DRAFT_1501263 [Desarmillaria tabescens]
MALPSELIYCILFELWAIQSSTEDYIQAFSICSTVSKQWSAIIKEVNSTHSVIPFDYSGGYLYTIRSMHTIPKPLLCRTITFKVDNLIMPWSIKNSGCEPSITANRGIESVLRKIFCGPISPPDGIHIFVDYLDDPQVHIPHFWVPLQTTHLTIVYHHRCWADVAFPNPYYCQCIQPILSRRVSHLCIIGTTTFIVKSLITPINEWECLVSLATDVLELDIPIPSFTRKTYNYETLDIGSEFLSRVMFGERGFRSTLVPMQHLSTHTYIPMFEQAIPLGSVGYIHPFTKKFVILFNAIDPASSMEPAIRHIPCLLKNGRTKLITDPKYPVSRAWDYEYKKSDILRKLGAWTKGRSFVFLCGQYFSASNGTRVYSITLAYNFVKTLFLGLGNAISRELVGDQFENWLSEHRQTIIDVFGDRDPYIRTHLGLGEAIVHVMYTNFMD